MKIYLSLIFLTLTLFTTKAQFLIPISNSCDINLRVKKITKNTNCNNPDGKIEIDIFGKSAPFSYKWTKYGKTVSTLKNPSGLNGGDYALTVRSLKNGLCSTKKHVFIHGVIFSDDNCPQNREMAVMKSVSITEGKDNFYVSVNWDPSSYGKEAGDLLYREKTGLENGTFAFWEELPKAKAVMDLPKGQYTFTKGKAYEFINAFEKSEFVGFNTGLVSKSITVEYYTNNQGITFKDKNTIADSKVSLSPQPASDYLTLSLSPELKANSLEVLALNGQLKKEIISDSFENLKLDVSDLETGLYLLKISSETEALFKKIIIK